MPAKPADLASWEREAAPFWAAAANGRLVLQYCDGCGRCVHYPRSHCPQCLSSYLSWHESAGAGSVYSFTVVHRSPATVDQPAPYVVALIDLDEGVRMMSNVVDCLVDDVTVGMRVRVWFADRRGRTVPVFVPA